MKWTRFITRVACGVVNPESSGCALSIDSLAAKYSFQKCKTVVGLFKRVIAATPSRPATSVSGLFGTPKRSLKSPADRRSHCYKRSQLGPFIRVYLRGVLGLFLGLFLSLAGLSKGGTRHPDLGATFRSVRASHIGGRSFRFSSLRKRHLSLSAGFYLPKALLPQPVQRFLDSWFEG
jgi:hypothetical protein